MFNTIVLLGIGDVIGETVQPLTRLINVVKKDPLPVAGFWPSDPRTVVIVNPSAMTPVEEAARRVAVENATAEIREATKKAVAEAKSAADRAEKLSIARDKKRLGMQLTPDEAALLA